MTYYADEELLIRDLRSEDTQRLCDEEVAQGWQQTIDKYINRLRDQAEGRCISLVAVYNGEPAGYINVYPASEWGPFGGRGWPELVDLAVLEKFRRHGIGSRLMDVAEGLARQYGDTVYLGVGLHSGYGPAQRLYVRRGYLPDGRGAYYHNQLAVPYQSYCLDDDLTLYLSKKL